MDKNGRNYSLTIDTLHGGSLLIKPPFSIEFDIQRNTLVSSNVASFRIYNLSENHRNLIRKDFTDFDDIRNITFLAGYGNNLSMAFRGNIGQAWSVREGTNFITQIECVDGGFSFSNDDISLGPYPDGTSTKTIFDDLISNMTGITYGAIGSFPNKITRGNSYSGSPMEVLKELSGNSFFVDNGKAYVLNEKEALGNDIMKIDSSTGLLGSPVKENQYVNFSMLFEPGLKPGQLIQLDTITVINLIGQFKVLSIKHRGIISESVCGDAVTSVGCIFGTYQKVYENE